MTPRVVKVMRLPDHLVELDGWVEIPDAGWFLEVKPHGDNGSPDFWWWHDCPARPGGGGLRGIDCSTGERHAIIAGALTEGNLTIGGGSGSIICDPDNDGCGLHGWIRNGEWVRA